jgi:isochorismate synthase
MNQNEIIQKIKNHKYIDLINSINTEHFNYSSDFFLFKSKNNDTFFLGFGNQNKVTAENLENEKVPIAVIGNFEDDCQYIAFDQYIFYKNGTLDSKIKIDLKAETNPTEDFKLKDIKYNQDQGEWEKMVAMALELIHQNQFKKIVLSRDITYLFEYLNPLSFINKLLDNNELAKNSFLIINKQKETWQVSLTPELLFEIENGLIRSMALAGSTPRGLNEIINLENEQHLLNDEKLSLEHGIVTQEIVNNFSELCDRYEVSPVNILKLDYIQHRVQTIVGKLRHKMHIHHAIKLLHPTPAVGTMPKQNGIKIINQIENKKRGFYASPIGVHYKHYSEVAVMLRSATITDNQIVLHSGCGITIGSTAQNEWEETENKTRPYKRLFNQQ